ncbi:extracellular serine proteinase-like [Amphiura filiformis]|uniref:extracellular serine proteinase-like n=1 Tax=Amphiura filiformis TaxID=82378 RepID=UPI003B225FE8
MRLLVLAVLVAVSSANLAPLFTHEKNIPGEYIVALKPDVDLDEFRSWVDNRFANEAGIHIKREFRKVFQGFEAAMDRLALREIRSQDNVAFVEEDMIVETFANAETWGLDRVDQRGLPLDGDANFPGTGAGVTAYIIDTGIYPDNQYFESRAAVAFDAIDDGEEGIDCNGHGTHCAGTVGSNPYGIARGASLRGVRVLSCTGSGSLSGVLAGMDWVAANHDGPSIASMSIGGGSSTSVNRAVKGMVTSGVAVSAAAGNSNSNACYYSPAGAPEAIAVGATELQTDTQDGRAYFSNYGECVDIFAPGVDILSTGIGSRETYTTSGTSMACPHVTGALCVLLGNDNTLTPEQLETKLMDMATSDVIDDVGNGSPNKLLYIGTDAVRAKSRLRFGSPNGGVKMMQQNGFKSRDIIQ